MRTPAAIDAARAELAEKRAVIDADIRAIERPHEGHVADGRWIDGPPLTAGERERIANLRRGLARLDEQDAAIDEEERPAREARRAAITRTAMNPNSTERPGMSGPVRTPEYDDDPSGSRRAGFEFPEYTEHRQARLNAFRTLERHAPTMTAGAVDRLDSLIRRKDAADEAAYLAAVGAPGYLAAFSKVMLDPTTGHMRFTPTERAAWERVIEVRGTAMGIGSGPIGGFAAPWQLDPTIVDVTAGTICPLRQLATVRLMTANEWRFVNSTAVLSQYQAEAAAVPEGGPTLSQPTLTAARGSAYVTISIELLEDDPAVVAELATMMRASRDRLDAAKFLTGSGANEPLGIMVPGTAGSLTASQRVQTAVADTFTAVDAYNLFAAIDPAARANLAWVMNPVTRAYVYRMTPVGSEDEPQLIPGTIDGPFLGAPVYDWSTMSTAQTVCVTGEQVIIGGDFRNGVTIGDRLGTTIEVIPQIFEHAAGSRPTGQRGLVMWWRSGCLVRNPNALRYLEIA